MNASPEKNPTPVPNVITPSKDGARIISVPEANRTR
jgi:hypothetical protein